VTGGTEGNWRGRFSGVACCFNCSCSHKTVTAKPSPTPNYHTANVRAIGRRQRSGFGACGCGADAALCGAADFWAAVIGSCFCCFPPPVCCCCCCCCCLVTTQPRASNPSPKAYTTHGPAEQSDARQFCNIHASKPERAFERREREREEVKLLLQKGESVNSPSRANAAPAPPTRRNARRAKLPLRSRRPAAGASPLPLSPPAS